MKWAIFYSEWRTLYFFICGTNIQVRLLTLNMKNCLTPKNPKICDPILVTLSKMRPHYSQSSRENATPSSSTFSLASHKEEVPPPDRNNGGSLYTAFRPAQQFSITQPLCLKMDVKCLNFKQLTKQYPYHSEQFYKGLFIFWWKKKNTWIDSSPGISTVHSLELSQLPKWRQTSLLQSNQIQYNYYVQNYPP